MRHITISYQIQRQQCSNKPFYTCHQPTNWEGLKATGILQNLVNRFPFMYLRTYFESEMN